MGRWKAAVVVLALVLAGCSGSGSKTSGGAVDEKVGVTGPQTYKLEMDAPSPDGQHVSTAAFFPARVKVRPGDTVIFENRSTDAPHTVSFGLPAFDPQGPKLSTKAGLPNPVVFGPCFTSEQPGPDTETCPTPPPATPPAYTGTGFWNSGVIAPGQSFSMTFAPEAEATVYNYGCLLHRFMSSALEVVESDADRESPAEVAREAEHHRTSLLASNGRIAEPVAAQGIVTAGWGNTLAAFNRFSPAVTRVKAGQTVTWQTASPFEPHTVTFESPFKSPEDPGVFTPGGARSGARYSGGFAHSGIFGPEPFFPKGPFSLTFTKPGTYSYVCVLHPGMAGQVEVTP
ncbi:MAG TPA: plastocyanin/azurin family copper-binding protein [Acidimicrobiia bacterium]|nr:plastocyanin/azurin family copper-binding protein [Acidimicrobiia bacterium]